MNTITDHALNPATGDCQCDFQRHPCPQILFQVYSSMCRNGLNRLDQAEKLKVTTVIMPGSMLLYSVVIPTVEAIVQLYFYLATLCSMQDLSSQIGDGTHAPCTGSRVLTTGQPEKSLLQLFLREVYINCFLTADMFARISFFGMHWLYTGHSPQNTQV